MSIKVTAFQALQPLFCENDEQVQALRQEMFDEIRLNGDSGLVPLSKHPTFPERADWLPSGFYRRQGDKVQKDLGTLADFTNFKDILAQKFYGKTLAQVFEEPAPGPFFELLYWSELGADYAMGPKTCEKLQQDFMDNWNQAEGIGGPWFTKYATMKLCFETAAKSGAVRFSGP